MTFRDHFSGHAQAYAQFRPQYGRELFAWLAELSPMHTLAWDCATGNGQAAVALADFFAYVIATDASETQIGHAVPNDRIEYRVAPAEKSGLAALSCDLITVAQALHWFDVEEFYSEAARVLKPTGVLAIWSYNLLEIEPAIDTVVNEFYYVTVGPYWPPERAFVEDGYRDLPFPFAEIHPPAFSMTAAWSLNNLLGYLRTWSASQRFQREKGHDPVALIEAKLRDFWADPEGTRTVRWPLTLRVGRKPS